MEIEGRRSRFQLKNGQVPTQFKAEYQTMKPARFTATTQKHLNATLGGQHSLWQRCYSFVCVIKCK
jgi:hypothetical protein